MKYNDLISIVMPTYNSEKYVGDAITSVLKQSYENWELLVIDDCSKDNTLTEAKKFHDPRIRIVALPQNGGAGLARNEALKRARGELIAFLDADDIWLPNKLEQQISYLKAKSAAICHTSYSFINEEGKPVAGRVNASPLVDLNHYMRNTEIGLSTAMIDKSRVGEFFFNPMRLRQDTRLWIELLYRKHLAQGLDEPLTRYRVRQGQISGNKINAAVKTFKLYMSIKELPLSTRLINYLFYIMHAILKRLR